VYVAALEVFAEFESVLGLVGSEVEGIAAIASSVEDYWLGFHYSVHGVGVGVEGSSAAVRIVESHNSYLAWISIAVDHSIIRRA